MNCNKSLPLVSFFSVLFFVILNVLAESQEEKSTADPDVVLVNVLFRHGDRTPVHPYPLDPYGNLSYWSTGWGQLTTTGMHQHYELGQWLRQRYNTLLGSDYSKNDVYVQSTDVDRTLMSAESNLAGIFPPKEAHIFAKGLKWQPIPIHTIPEHMDHILAMKKLCPRFDDEFEKARKLPEISALEKDYKKMFAYISLHTGTEVKTIENAEYIHSTLYIESVKNLTLPEWTKKVYPEPLQTLAGYSFALPAYTPELKRLKGGPLVGEWLEHFRRKKLGTLDPDRKMFLYSAHDTTVANILNTLNVFERHCPPYASTVLLELQKKKNDYYVALFYKNSSNARQLTIPGCSALCPFDKFVELTSPVVPEHWEKECHYHYLSAEDFNTITIAALSLCGILSLVLLSISVIAIINHRRQKNDPFRYQSVSTNGDP